MLLLLAYGFYDINYLQRQRPVAKVGKYAILVNQFEPRVRMQRQQLLAQYNQYSQYGQMFGMDVQHQLDQIKSQLDTPETIGQSVLDQLINEQLIRLEAEKRGITISDAELAKEKQNSFGFYPNGTPTSAPTPTEVIMPKIPAEAFKVVTITPTPTATLEPTATVTPAVTATPAGSHSNHGLYCHTRTNSHPIHTGRFRGQIQRITKSDDETWPQRKGLSFTL